MRTDVTLGSDNEFEIMSLIAGVSWIRLALRKRLVPSGELRFRTATATGLAGSVYDSIPGQRPLVADTIPSRLIESDVAMFGMRDGEGIWSMDDRPR